MSLQSDCRVLLGLIGTNSGEQDRVHKNVYKNREDMMGTAGERSVKIVGLARLFRMLERV